ncbi:MAG: acyl-CoA/acyl-ACP dehydrogenase [Deltaproteobacteria bacterium]|nr:acyl-CoA/acyl-ACP dehydrogenase [Deltaproteobacteria bacterium]
MLTYTNPELKPFEELAGQFARNELASGREEHDNYPFGPFFHGVLARAHEAGFLGIILPEHQGGIGQGTGALCVILDSISRADASLAGILFTTALAQQILMEAGAFDAIRTITGGASKAEEALIAFPAFANPSELAPSVFAKNEEGRYTLFGTCDYLVLGGLARYGLIPARVHGRKGYSFFIVDLAAPGVTKSGPVVSLGFHACPAVDVKIRDVDGTIAGSEGDGAVLFERAAEKMHIAAAAIACGIMKGSFVEALSYAKERFQGGREIVKWSEVRMILANMAVKVDVADMTLAGACRAAEEKHPGWETKSRAVAIRIQDDACELTTDGIQVLGGYGYMKDYGQEKRFRDAKQVQALLGMAPMKKLKYFEKVAE